MTEKTIKISGKEYPVIFNMQTILNFEEGAKKSFFGEPFNRIWERLVLVSAAIYAKTKKPAFNIEELVENATSSTINEITAAFTTVMELAAEFFEIPAIEPKEEHKEETSEEGDTKN